MKAITTLAFVPLALAIGGVIAPAHSQTDPSKTGAGPRGTAVAPSTDPSQTGSVSGRPGGQSNKLGVPPSTAATDANTGAANQSAIKPNHPQQGPGQ